MKCLDKSFPKSFKEGQRPAQKQNIPLDFPPLGQSADGLADDRTVNRGGYILFPRSLIEQGLNIAFGKNPASRGHWINLGRFKRQVIKFIDRNVKKRSHL